MIRPVQDERPDSSTAHSRLPLPPLSEGKTQPPSPLTTSQMERSLVWPLKQSGLISSNTYVDSYYATDIMLRHIFLHSSGNHRDGLKKVWSPNISWPVRSSVQRSKLNVEWGVFTEIKEPLWVKWKISENTWVTTLRENDVWYMMHVWWSFKQKRKDCIYAAGQGYISVWHLNTVLQNKNNLFKKMFTYGSC